MLLFISRLDCALANDLTAAERAGFVYLCTLQLSPIAQGPDAKVMALAQAADRSLCKYLDISSLKLLPSSAVWHRLSPPHNISHSPRPDASSGDVADDDNDDAFNLDVVRSVARPGVSSPLSKQRNEKSSQGKPRYVC